MATCQARVQGKTIKIPGTDLKAYTVKECGKAAHTNVPIDNGEAEIPLCLGCSKRYEKRDSPVCPWLGFFDGDVPPNVRIVGSTWYANAVKEGTDLTFLTSALAAVKIDAPPAKRS
jgi:hypothetical protein